MNEKLERGNCDFSLLNTANENWSLFQQRSIFVPQDLNI